MSKRTFLAGLLAVWGFATFGRAENPEKNIRKAVEKSRLHGPGTAPFHLKAVIAPTRAVDQGSGRTGEIEIWWASPSQWRREVRSPEFHQIAVFNGGHEWQKNDGDYFPEWLREIAVALIDPVPDIQQTLEQVETGEVRKLMGSTYYSWMAMSSDGNVKKSMGCTVAITDSTGLLFYAACVGWGGLYKDYKGFHGRMVPRDVSWGTPEITAKVTTLEDLRDTPPSFFDADAKGGDPLITTTVIDEGSLRKNLLPTAPAAWPALPNGALEGILTTSVTIDRKGNVREIGTIVSDNSAISEAARKVIAGMKFTPFLLDGVAVQVVSRITMPFKAERPQAR